MPSRINMTNWVISLVANLTVSVVVLLQEVAECLKELQSPSRHDVFVEVTFNHTMEKKAIERQATGKLIHFLMRDCVLTAQQYLNGYVKFNV